jgi:hypothetical protein
MNTSIVTQPRRNSHKGRTLTVKLRQDVAQAIGELATRRQLQTEVLVNEILEQHIQAQLMAPKSSSAAFLLSIAGMFNSGIEDTSENVRLVVTDFILQKHPGPPAL